MTDYKELESRFEKAKRNLSLSNYALEFSILAAAFTVPGIVTDPTSISRYLITAGFLVPCFLSKRWKDNSRREYRLLYSQMPAEKRGLLQD